MSDIDLELLYLFNNGKYYHAFNIFGAHPACFGNEEGFTFTVWAPDVRSVRVVGDYNGWREKGAELSMIGTTGVWSGFIPGIKSGMRYKYLVLTRDGEMIYKADPFAFMAECRPATASVTHTLNYEWHDKRWMGKRAVSDHFHAPMNIYEVHAGSWRRDLPGDGRCPGDENGEGAFYTYRRLAEELVPYVKDMGYTHIEFLPLMEHPFDGSWGYQITGYYAPTSRYGGPEDLMYLIDTAHKAGIGVILDWVPGHFCRDAHGLGRFNGHKLYEKNDHAQWGTYKFDFSRSEVRSFLLSNVMFWLEKYHADGIRVDGVTSMLYLNFGVSDPSGKVFNADGGEEDTDAISFLREMCSMVGNYFPGVITAAEESTDWPMVTLPCEKGGLGFHYKWNMGWMNDTLRYFSTDFPSRGDSHRLLTFSMMYAFSENFILPLSHDEVVHGKRSLIGRMPGDYWRQFAGLRLLAVYQALQPGGMLSFMGNEFGQFIEWRYYESLEWFLLRYDSHRRHQDFIRDLNRVYLRERALWSNDRDWKGFSWIDTDNADQRILIFARISDSRRFVDVAVLNFDVQTFENFRVGVLRPGVYREIFSSDAEKYGGSGRVNQCDLVAEAVPFHGQPYSVTLTVPPLGGTLLKRLPASGGKSKNVHQ